MNDPSVDPTKAYLTSGATHIKTKSRGDALWRGDNIQRGPGLLRRGSGSAGFTLATFGGAGNAPSFGGGGSKIAWPISINADPSNPLLSQINVGNGDLLLSLQPSDYATVTGLNSPVSTPATGTAGTVLDIVALVIDVSSFAETSATIKTKVAGGLGFDPTLAAWDSSNNAYVWDDHGTPPSQVGINFLLGYTVANAAGKATVIQACTTHLLLANTFIDPEPALYPVPSPYRRWGLTSP